VFKISPYKDRITEEKEIFDIKGEKL